MQGKLNALRWQRLKVTAASCIFMLRDIRGIVWQAALWVHRERSCLCRTWLSHDNRFCSAIVFVVFTQWRGCFNLMSLAVNEVVALM